MISHHKTQTDDTSLGHLTCARTCIELRLKTACQELTRQMSTWRKVYNADSFFFRPHSEQVNTPMEVPVWSENEKEEGYHCKIKH